MAICPARARAILPQVDPARQRSGEPVGLRDGALVALMAAGLTAEEIAGLEASAITMERGSVLVTIRRHHITWEAVLPIDLGGRLLAWLTESRLWAENKAVFFSSRGPLSPMAVRQVLYRYQQRRFDP